MAKTNETKQWHGFEMDINRKALKRIQDNLNTVALAYISNETVRELAEKFQKELDIILAPFRKEQVDDILKKKREGRKLIVDSDL